MKSFFERAQDIEGCEVCVKQAAERQNSKGGYTWFGALRGWDCGCKICFAKIEALWVEIEAEKKKANV